MGRKNAIAMPGIAGPPRLVCLRPVVGKMGCVILIPHLANNGRKVGKEMKKSGGVRDPLFLTLSAKERSLETPSFCDKNSGR